MSRMLERALLTAMCFFPLVPARAQGFQQGDLYLYSPAITGISSSGGALVHVDLNTATASILLNFTYTRQYQGSMAFDPHRNALILFAVLGAASNPWELWACDAQGNTQSLGFANRNFSALAPTGDGRIYLRDRSAPVGQVHYIDRNNQLHTLLDATGTAPFEFLPGQPQHHEWLLYHAPTNALFAASTSGLSFDCSGTGRASGLLVRRATLSADGARVVGPTTCVEFEVSSSGETPVGMDVLADGTLLVVVDTNSNANEPRMVRIDPWTMSASPFASNGSYIGAAATNAGCRSSVLGRVVVLDTFSDGLRAFSQGESGTGTLLTLSMPLSHGGSSGEVATLVEARGSSCAGTFRGYGDGLAGTLGFVPSLTGTGCPLPGGNVTLHIASGLGSAPAVLVIGSTATSVPLLGGTLLVLPQVFLNLGLQGTPGAAGAGHAALPALLPNDPSLSGHGLFLQAAMFDPGAVQSFAFTPGLEMRIG